MFLYNTLYNVYVDVIVSQTPFCLHNINFHMIMHPDFTSQITKSQTIQIKTFLRGHVPSDAHTFLHVSQQSSAPLFYLNQT